MLHKSQELLNKTDILQKIRESLAKTANTNKEHGFNICASNGIIYSTSIEQGKKGGIDPKDSCKKEETVGAFHTHTYLTKDKDIVPSPRDVIKSAEEDFKIFCIGGNKENTAIIRCFYRDDLLLEMHHIIDHTKKPINQDNIRRAARHVVGRMLSDKDYLNQHSYLKEITI